MASEPLTDHCGVTDYLTKVNTFMEVHLPNFTRLNFQGEQLSDVYIDWMPPINASEGRVLRRELCEKRDRIAEARVRAGRIVNAANKAAALAQIAIMPRGIEAPESVLIACTKIISGSADTTVEHARLAASSLPASTNAETTKRDAAVAFAATMRPGMAAPSGISDGGNPLTHSTDHAASTRTVAAAAKKARKDEAQRLLAAAAGRADKENKRESKLLPVGKWCPKGTCRWPHGPNEPCFSDPNWEGPLPPEIQADPLHVIRIEKRRVACAERLHKEGKYPSLKPKKLKTGSVRPGGANVLYVPQPVFDPEPSYIWPRRVTVATT